MGGEEEMIRQDARGVGQREEMIGGIHVRNNREKTKVQVNYKENERELENKEIHRTTNERIIIEIFDRYDDDRQIFFLFFLFLILTACVGERWVRSEHRDERS